MEEPWTVWIEGIWDVDTFYKRRWDQISYDDNIQYQKTKKDLGSMKDSRKELVTRTGRTMI